MTANIARRLEIQWVAQNWRPRIVQADRQLEYCVNRHKGSMSPMKRLGHHRRMGFTLIELLVVISIIGVLAALLLPTLANAKKRGQVAKAKTELRNIEGAILTYQAEYGRYPADPAIRRALNPGNPDFTFGTMYRAGDGSQSALLNKKGAVLPSVINSGSPATQIQASNADVVAILRNRDKRQNLGTNNHPANIKGTVFLNAKDVDTVGTSGIGPDGVYRDPWGNPYIITLDLDYSDTCMDGFYRKSGVSNGGLNGLSTTGAAGTDTYQARTKVMVWSFGPDGLVDPGTRANQGVNKDNLLSW